MKKLLVAVALVVLMVSSLRSQPALRIFTSPKTPPQDVLDRLDLTAAWRTKLPTAGQRDGLFTLQLISTRKRSQLVVQTILGAVYMLDAETGDFLWRTTVGLPSWSGQPVGYNEQNLFVIRRDIVYVLNRATGAQRFYTLDKDTKLPRYGFHLSAAPSAAARADADMLFFCLGNRVEAYLMPDWDLSEASLQSEAFKELSELERKELLDKTTAIPPLLKWSHQQAGMDVEQPVLLAGDQVTAVSTAGNVLSLNKHERSPIYEFKLSGNVAAPMGQHGPMAYIGSEDYTLYAIDMENQRLVWRFLASAPILTQPEVTDRDVFVTGRGQGLYRVERDTGRAIWLSRQADRFLSTNQKFVYALDRMGRLLVLDYARGATLAKYDMHDWIIPVANELTDRFYLASNDGQILCLRNRSETAPLRTKTTQTKLPALPKKAEPKEEKNDVKELDKDKDQKKDNERDENDKGKEKAAGLQRSPFAPREDGAKLNAAVTHWQSPYAWRRQSLAEQEGSYARMGP